MNAESRAVIIWYLWLFQHLEKAHCMGTVNYVLFISSARVFYLKNGGFLTLAGKTDPDKNQSESLFMNSCFRLQYNIIWSTVLQAIKPIKISIEMHTFSHLQGFFFEVEEGKEGLFP